VKKTEAKSGAKKRPAWRSVSMQTKAILAARDGFRIDVDMDEAERAAARVRGWLVALRERHQGLARYEFTRHVRIVPASATFSHPILTLGTRFAESEDHLLATYLHEQMHWYLWRLGGPDHDPVLPFFDELVRRYPKAPTRLPDGARNYEQTYVHLVVCWLELHAVAEFIGWERAAALAETNYGYRWIYRTVVRDREALGALFTQHGILPMPAAADMGKPVAKVPVPRGKIAAKPAAKKAAKKAAKNPAVNAAGKAASTPPAVRQKKPSEGRPLPSRPGRRKPQARGGKRAG
jgi:hypothetical protein